MKHSRSAQPLLGRLLAGVGIFAAALTVAACAHSAPQPPAPAAEVGPSAGEPEADPADPDAAAEETPEAEARRSSVIPIEPPEGTEWQVDEQGRRFFLLGIPKRTPHKWLDEEQSRVQTVYGLRFDVAKQDEDKFYVKMYDSAGEPPGGTPAPRAEAAEPAESAPAEEGEPAAVSRSRIAPPGDDLLELHPFDEGLPDAGQWRHGFELADMNGDGYLDLVHGPARKGSGRPVIFLGDGNGSWRRWSAASFPREPYDYGDVAVADFDGDGHQDLALAMHVRGLRVLVSDGEGRFSPWSEGIGYEDGPAKESTAFSSRAVEAVDWNSDGRPDLLAVGEGIKGRPLGGRDARGAGQWSRGVRLFLNNGDGTWTASPVDEAHRAFADTLAVGDFDGDGRTDAATGTMAAGSNRLVLLGDGDRGGEAWRIEGLDRRILVTAVAAGDLDGDGVDDLVLGVTGRGEGEVGAGSGIVILYSRPDGEGGLGWERETLLWREGERLLVNALAVGDLGGTPAPAVVALSDEGEVWVFARDRRGGFVMDRGSLREPVDGCQGYHAEIAPLAPGGTPVLLAAFAGERTGLPGLAPGMWKEGCARGGSIEAWRVDRRASSRSQRPRS